MSSYLWDAWSHLITGEAPSKVEEVNAGGIHTVFVDLELTSISMVTDSKVKESNATYKVRGNPAGEQRSLIRLRKPLE